jgi:hypothetical protein
MQVTNIDDLDWESEMFNFYFGYRNFGPVSIFKYTTVQTNSRAHSSPLDWWNHPGL